MRNAAWHAGGTVSVYLESSQAGITLSVTDRGPGFRVDQIPADRHGVRESIIGRMQRIGGSAMVRPGPGGSGTEILLTLPLVGSVASAEPDGAPGSTPVQAGTISEETSHDQP